MEPMLGFIPLTLAACLWYTLLPKSVYFYSEDKITNDVLNKIFLNEI